MPFPRRYTDIRSFTGVVGHYRRFIKNFAKIAAPLYNLTSGANKDKKSESVTLTPEALEAFDTLKKKCVQAPVLAFPDFQKPFLLETDASGKGLGMVLSQKQDDGRYHPVAYASRVLTETEQKYHSNKQEFLALKWAVTEQFHEYLSPYGKNSNEFVVRTDNNPLTCSHFPEKHGQFCPRITIFEIFLKLNPMKIKLVKIASKYKMNKNLSNDTQNGWAPGIFRTV